MVNDGKKSAGADPELVERGTVGVNHGAADTNMRTHSGNSAVDPGAQRAIDGRIQNHLGMKLKEAYDDLVRQPVPDKFNKLLEELERQEKKQ